ncbi:MAG: hypothetical protein KC443_04080 [Anaerolineales bacterium]|nr:hypothetical protein [Anaerolineales bacterium]MCB8966095.1 hypothetical protein [Ardenticatenaceae bacterium]
MQAGLSKQGTKQKSVQVGRAGAFWLIQAVSGLLLVLLLLLHMVAHHFVVEGGLRDFAEVLAYVSNPAIFTIEVVFLIVVISHAMLGLRAVIFDLGLNKRHARVVNWVLGVIGIVTLVYGVWLAVAIQQL